MSLRRTISGLFSAKRTQIFRAVERILRSDPVLSTVVKTWRTFEGDPSDTMPPSSDQCPLIQMSCATRTIDKTNEGQYLITFIIRIDAMVDGTCLDDAVDLWEAVENALINSKPFDGSNVADYLRNKAVTDPDGVPIPHQGTADTRWETGGILQPRAPSAEGRPGALLSMLVATGNYVCKIYRPF